MILAPKTVGGHRYWYITTSQRIDSRPTEKVLLYLGRLDGLPADALHAKVERVRALGDPALALQFDAALIKLGYPAPPPSLAAYDLRTVRSYGPELALVKAAEELDLVRIIDAHSPKGGGPPLGSMTLALAVYACLRPGSYWRFVEWYRRSPLPMFLHLPLDQVTYRATLSTLGYLQPPLTRRLETETYDRLRRRFGYRCDRIDIDSTVVELEGTLCRVLAKFGHSKSGGVSKRRQILITFLVDQRGALVGHEVFPGNRNDATTLTQVDRRLREGYDDEVRDSARVVDRGYTSLAKIRGMVRRKDRFIAALRSRPKGLKLLEAIGKPQRMWEEVETGVRVAGVVKDRLLWVVSWNDEVAQRTGDGRAAKLRMAKDALRGLQRAIGRGKVKSRAERDRKEGAILRRYGVTRFLRVRGKRKGFGFTVEETGKAREKGKADGYQVFVTTETELTPAEVFASYRARDRIEKSIRTLKSVLGLGPVHVSTKEHVLGHVYVHALAYQLRSVLGLRLEEARVELSPEEALWELERMQIAELVVKGEEVAVIRKLTRIDGTAKRLMHVFSLDENAESGLTERGT